MGRIKSVTIHNFRSIKEAKFNPYNYAVTVGANNAGKSNVFTALRIFYEEAIYMAMRTAFSQKAHFMVQRISLKPNWGQLYTFQR